MCRNHKTTNTLAYYRAQAENPSTQVAQPLDLTVWIRGTVNLTLPAPTQRQGGGIWNPPSLGAKRPHPSPSASRTSPATATRHHRAQPLREHHHHSTSDAVTAISGGRRAKFPSAAGGLYMTLHYTPWREYVAAAVIYRPAARTLLVVRELSLGGAD